MCFDLEYNYFGVTSNKGTIHIWKLDDIIEKVKENDVIKYNVKNVNSYKSEFSFAKIKIDKQNCIFCFKSLDRVLIIDPEEKCYISTLNKKGGYFPAKKEKDFSLYKEK